MRFDHDRYADINAIATFFGKDLSLALPAIHALSGCDTASYFFRVGKLKILKRVFKAQESCSLIKNLGLNGNITEDELDNAKEFIRTIFYGGNSNQTYVETRIRLYNDMKVKSSMCIPPDPDSVIQVIKRAHYQIYHWIRSTEINIEPIDYQQLGWKWSDEQQLVVPIWFTGSQLPPSLRNKRKKKQSSDNDNQEDVESDDERSTKRPKRKKKTTRKNQEEKLLDCSSKVIDTRSLEE